MLRAKLKQSAVAVTVSVIVTMLASALVAEATTVDSEGMAETMELSVTTENALEGNSDADATEVKLEATAEDESTVTELGMAVDTADAEALVGPKI